MLSAIADLIVQETYYLQLVLPSMMPFDTFDVINYPFLTAMYAKQMIFPEAILVFHTNSLAVAKNTAIAVKGDEVEVIGEGAVTILDVASVSHTNVDETLHDEALAICGVKLHILPHGYHFNVSSEFGVRSSE